MPLIEYVGGPFDGASCEVASLDPIPFFDSVPKRGFIEVGRYVDRSRCQPCPPTGRTLMRDGRWLFDWQPATL